MAFLKRLLTLFCMYSVLDYFPLICPAEIIENMYGNQDFKFAIQKINELQKIMRAQDDRFSMLEKDHSESKEHAVTDLQKLVKKTKQSYSPFREKNQRVRDCDKG